MTLADFIHGHHDEIIDAFEMFAATMMPAAGRMNSQELRDHAKEILIACVADMMRHQSSGEQSRKSKGEGVEVAMRASAFLHADGRLNHGFTPGQAIAEFRALRASVLRLYEDSGGADLSGVQRFNEAIDEALTESITRYTEQSNLFRDQFIGILGHDLRDPLNTIALSALILTQGPRANEFAEFAKLGAMISRSATRMERLIGDLLDVMTARYGGSIPLKRTRVDLGRVCKDTTAEIRAARPGAVVECMTSGELSGDWDSDRLAQVLFNLVGNAVQHGGGGTVTVDANGEGSEVMLSVHNDGPPIPPEFHQAIFDPFVRHTSGTDAPRGIGLGLFIAKAIVESHAGEIAVCSSESEGTTFTVRLPRQGPEIDAPAPRAFTARS